MPRSKPTGITVRTYDVGFGDCFLLTFHYKNRNRNVLIDFGSMRLPKGKIDQTGKPIKRRYMNHIAELIGEHCDQKLDVIVATHRHQDHISGFARRNGRGPGEIIRKLKPKMVIQPWTEDPLIATDATTPTSNLYIQTLSRMETVAGHVVGLAKSLRGKNLAQLRDELITIGMDNISNRDAIENLQTMGMNRFVHFGRSVGLGRILPGIRVTVLGPPTVKQTDTILRQRSSDPDEFWHLNASFWKSMAQTGAAVEVKREPLFKKHASPKVPRSAGWFKYTVTKERANSLLSIVRTLDNAMNNTSVILLFEAGDKSVLFPGDAQYENWMYALSKPSILDKLSNVNLYKVGHHGSLNATPRTLWRTMKNKGTATDINRLTTILSTKGGVHGHSERETEVPRQTLVNSLDQNSTLINTEEFEPNELYRETTLSLACTQR